MDQVAKILPNGGAATGATQREFLARACPPDRLTDVLAAKPACCQQCRHRQGLVRGLANSCSAGLRCECRMAANRPSCLFLALLKSDTLVSTG